MDNDLGANIDKDIRFYLSSVVSKSAVKRLIFQTFSYFFRSKLVGIN